MSASHNTGTAGGDADTPSLQPESQATPILDVAVDGIHSTEFLTASSAVLMLEHQHLITLIGWNQSSVMLSMSGLRSWLLLARLGFCALGLGVWVL